MKRVRLTENDINRVVNRVVKRIVKEEGADWEWFDQFEFQREKPKRKVKKDYESLRYKNVKKGDILIIHPDDRTTDFLKPSYEGLNATVLTQEDQFYNLRETIRNHNRIIMMGHGSPYGLFMPQIEGIEVDKNGELYEYNAYSINNSFADVLRDKRIVAVWCNADRYVVPNKLHGFYTGMAISELCEADYCDVKGCNPKQLEESSTTFAIALKESLKVDGPESVDIFKEIYHNPNNPIMVYNRKRIYFAN